MIKLALAPLVLLAADLRPADGPPYVSFKDEPAIVTESARPKPHTRALGAPPVPRENVLDRMEEGWQPYVIVEGFPPTKRLAVSPRNMARYGLQIGDVVSVRTASEIVQDQMKQAPQE